MHTPLLDVHRLLVILIILIPTVCFTWRSRLYIYIYALVWISVLIAYRKHQVAVSMTGTSGLLYTPLPNKKIPSVQNRRLEKIRDILCRSTKARQFFNYYRMPVKAFSLKIEYTVCAYRQLRLHILESLSYINIFSHVQEIFQTIPDFLELATTNFE